MQERKADHIEICANENVNAEYNHWDDITFVHNALPEVDLDDIELKIKLFGKTLQAPIIIAAITGGYSGAEKINRNLAKAAEAVGIGMGVGSQRPALKDRSLSKSYEVLKEYDIPLRIGNTGAPQIIDQKGDPALEPEDIGFAMEMVGADIMAVHLNYLQEIAQPEGDHDAEGCMEAIRQMALHFPILAKETGAGISKHVALSLKHAGVFGIDVGGMGGTSWLAVEYYRARKEKDELRMRLGKTFWNWGIPTPVSVVEANVGLPIIATGGIRNGLDVARAICIGASAAGTANHLLKPALEGAEAVVMELEMMIQELKVAMFLTGSANCKELSDKGLVVTGPTRQWLEELR
jgi:isopentenyl-diphosphate delta-isomerase